SRDSPTSWPPDSRAPAATCQTVGARPPASSTPWHGSNLPTASTSTSASSPRPGTSWSRSSTSSRRDASLGDVTRAEPPFFVVGNPRSGTKMLRELLNASPDLWISDIESHFIPRFTRTIGEYDDLAERENFRRLADDLRRTRAFWYWKKRGIWIDTDRWYGH